MKCFGRKIPSEIGFPASFVILALATLLVWHNSLSGGLWADDSIYLLFAREASLKSLLNIWIIKEEYLRDYWMQYVSFTGGAGRGGGMALYWRPVTNLLTALDVRLWGDNYAGYHFTNILGHFLTALLLQRVAMKMGFSSFWALLISLLWMALPSHTITVSWISARHDIFSTLFALLCFNSYLSWSENPQSKKVFYGTLFFLLALGCKATVLPLPGVILVHALLKRRLAKNEESATAKTESLLWQSLLFWGVPLMLISVGMFLLMTHWPIPNGFKRLTDDSLRTFSERNPWLNFVLPIQYIFQFLLGVVPFELEAMPWPTFALSAGVFIWWSLFILLAVFRRNITFVCGAAWFFLMITPLFFIKVGTHYVYDATPGGALATAAVIKHVMYRPPLWKKIFAASAAVYMFCFWTFSATLGSAWYSFLPQANELIMSNLKKTLPALESRKGQPYRKVYIFNAWSLIHHFGYQIRLAYNTPDIPIRILTIDPEYYPKDLDLPFSAQNGWLAGMLTPFRTERHIDYKIIDRHSIEVINRESGMFTTMLERKVLLDANLPHTGKTYSFDFEPGDGNSYTARIEESDQAGLPTRIRFRFEKPLDDPETLFLMQQGSRFIKMNFRQIAQNQIHSAR